MPKTSSLDDIMDQADTELDFILEAEAAIRSKAPFGKEAQTSRQAINAKGGPHLEGDDFVCVLNLDLFNGPPMKGLPSLLDSFGNSFHLEDVDEPSLTALTTSGGDTLELPFIFSNLAFTSRSKVSIPSLPFSTSPKGGEESSPTLPIGNLQTSPPSGSPF